MTNSTHLEFIELRPLESGFVSVGVCLGTLIGMYVAQKDIKSQYFSFFYKLCMMSIGTGLGAFGGGFLGLCAAITWPRSAIPIIGAMVGMVMVCKSSK